MFLIGYKAESQSIFFFTKDNTWDKNAAISRVKVFYDKSFAEEEAKELNQKYNNYCTVFPYKSLLQK